MRSNCARRGARAQVEPVQAWRREGAQVAEQPDVTDEKNARQRRSRARLEKSTMRLRTRKRAVAAGAGGASVLESAAVGCAVRGRGARCEVRVVGVEGDTQLSQVNGGRWTATQRRRWSETGMRWLAVSIADSCTRRSGVWSLVAGGEDWGSALSAGRLRNGKQISGTQQKQDLGQHPQHTTMTTVGARTGLASCRSNTDTKADRRRSYDQRARSGEQRRREERITEISFGAGWREKEEWPGRAFDIDLLNAALDMHRAPTLALQMGKGACEMGRCVLHRCDQAAKDGQ
ncbi:hypothetical protein SVAN01_09848 [Stagonosporopsis vannaccii]|nr:hypothetical protein SVAN01_09848 [Stagonosporopsis vannaccii]